MRENGFLVTVNESLASAQTKTADLLKTEDDDDEDMWL
jgi:hypothetical protein